ncbi:LuxR family transcriptional regulator [Nocardioides sp. JQ2195]|uniref:ATP-binding protein n=1 Tax=Nocardioides sp. JQ2195 TaxID=2592334 RepID=UPI00143E47E3|nr:LuxR C-terminal-related transcriptional regulator [Nocardioides sp. JQ2195]QIX27759.1 LuxR family transcriptional regulator [Nocardioides sp. JQ2195]
MSGAGERLTTFIGRDDMLREVRALLGWSRLVTLTGTGGVGKTRLSLEVAERTRHLFADGATFVDLASLGASAAVAPAMVSALGIVDQSTRTPMEQLQRHLSDKAGLIVIDNCEHVLEEVADLVGDLLELAPETCILATSREPLGLPSEQVFPVGPLDLPEAVRLLVDRTRHQVPGFAVTEANRTVVERLCETLDGLPLAIELAATRLRSLSVEQLLERLHHRFQLLRGDVRGRLKRHQALWDLVDWSHDLCSPDEQLLWARLSVFRGGLDLVAVETVCGFGALDADRIVDVLDQLVAKSIVVAEPGGTQMRFRMLVTMREYGAEKLHAAGETEELRRRHCDHYLARARAMVESWSGPRQPEALAAMRRDHANVLAALEWSATAPGEQEKAATLGSLLRYHWIAGGFLSDGRRWLERILALDLGRTPEHGAALWVAAWVCLIQGDRPAGARHLATCRDLAEELDDQHLLAHVNAWTGLLELFSGNLEESMQAYEDAIEAFGQFGDDAAAQTAMFQLAMAEYFAIGPERALETCDRVVAWCSEKGEGWCLAYSSWITGMCHWRLGDQVAAKAAGVAALELQREFLDGICIALTLELASWISSANERFENAAALFGAATAVWSLLGTDVDAFGPHISADSRRVVEEVDAAIGHPRAERLRAGQRTLDRAGAVLLGLGTGADPSAVVADNPLTKREQQVAELVAEGMSNRQIAERLVISNRTVDGHVERILAKLEVRTRTQVATWVMGRRV